MSILKSYSERADFNWLPEKYEFQELVLRNDFGFFSIRAIDSSLSCEVLIELVPASHFDSDGLFRLQHYFGCASRIQHQSFIAPTDQSFVKDRKGTEYVLLARPYVQGTTLEQLLVEVRMPESDTNWGSKLPVSTKARNLWMRSLLLAIEQFHATGITQQDFRPSRILVEDRVPRLICPGLRLFLKSRVRDEAWTLAFVKSASPELMGLIEHDVNDCSDIYSAGVIFHCILTGKLPFNGSTMSQVLSAHLTKEIEDDSPVRCPLLKIVSKMLEKNPNDRYQSVSAIVEDLDWLVENENKVDFDGFVTGSTEVRDSVSVPVFVGRKDVKSIIRNAIDEVRGGSSRFVLATGESGFGKTRLITEALDEASKLGLKIHHCEATEKAGGLAVAPLADLIQKLVHVELSDSIVRHLDDAREDIHFFFPHFAKSIGLPEPLSLTSAKKAEEDENTELFEINRLNRLNRAICKVLSSLGAPHEPAIIWIDDCQWLDKSTIDALCELSRWETSSLMVILSARTSSCENDLALLEIDFDAEIEVGPLSTEQLTELVDSMAVGLPKRAVENIVRLSDGSPFMAESMLRNLVENEAVVFRDSRWTIDDEKFNEFHASTDATEALLARLEHFPPKVMEQLSIAAIIGQSFFSSTVAAIAQTSVTETQRHIAWARKKRLIWSRPDGSRAFVHDRIRVAMIEKLPAGTKIETHIRLAEYFEANDGDPIDIAFHFDQANLVDRALPHALIAAEQAQDAASLSAATEMYKIALKGVPAKDSTTRSQISEKLGSVLMLAGKYDESDHWFLKAANSAENNVDGARIEMQRGELAFKRGDKSKAVDLLEDAMKLLNIHIPKSWSMTHVFVCWEIFIQLLHSLFPSVFVHRKKTVTKRERMIWRMYSRLAHCYWYTRGHAIVLWAHLAGMNRAETGPPTRELAQAYSEHAPLMSLFPWYTRGAAYSERSLKIRSDLKDRWGEGQSRNYFSILLYATSKFEKCIVQSRKAEKVLIRTGDYWELNIARFQHAAALYRQGNLKEAYELALKTRQDALKIGDFQSTGNIIDILSRASLGKIPLQFLAMEKERDLDDLQLQPQILLAEGVYHLCNGNDPSVAASCFERALEIVKKTGVCNAYTAPNAPWYATALRETIAKERKAGTVSKKSFKRHFAAAKRAVRLAQRFQNDLPHALRELGFAYADKLDQKRARKALIDSLNLAQSQGAKYEAALTQQAFEKMDMRFGWREVNEENQSGTHEVRQIEATVRLNAPRETVSIANRFDALLDAGRKISSALGKDDILKRTVESAAELLRGQTTLVVLPDEEDPKQWNAWNSDAEFDRETILKAVETMQPVIGDRELVEGGTESNGCTASVLCCPIVASKEVVACIYISNRLIESMFGSNEIRIAEFIGNAAGSSLEKETSFRELDELNASLEEKVLDRTKSLQARTRELEQTAQQLRATQHSLKRAAQAAESANQIKSDFLAKMSHEIRTPITAVLGFTQLILRGVIVDPDAQLNKIRSIESNGKHLLQLVNDLLDISKIEADKIEIEKVDCGLLHLLNESVESLRSKANQNKNDLVLDLVAPLPARIQSDPIRLRQVINNILGNAIKFTSDGTVTIRTRFEERGSRGMLRIDVIDTGLGMTPEQLKNVFDPFVQADSSITRRFGGTGLGLSISQKLTRALGGDIEVVSTSGEGSTFSISIDAGQLDELELMHEEEFENFFKRQTTSEWVVADLSSLRILMADDAETNRDLVSLVLEDCGANITLAVNGQEAVDHALSDAKFDIILMDMQMPILDGYSATRKLRSEGYEGPIYALTANSMKGDKEKCLEAGCSEFLTKPIDLNGLVKAMAKLARTDVTSVIEKEDHCDTRHVSISDAREEVKPENESESDAADESDSLKFSESDLPANVKVRKFTFNFIKTLHERRAEFEQCMEKRDADEFADLAHWLKGTSGTVMLRELAATAKEMEASVKANDWEAVETLFRVIEIYSDEAMEFASQQPVPQ